MTITLPAKLRATLYVLLSISAPAVAYCAAKGWVGTDELGLYAALSGVIGTIAGLHMTASDPQDGPAPSDPIDEH